MNAYMLAIYNLIKINFNNFNSLFNEFIRDLLFKNFNERKLDFTKYFVK